MSALFHFEEYINVIKHYFKEMKKIEYIAPEMEEIKLLHNAALLESSNEDIAPGTGGDTDEY